jgi:F420-dependent oxidoreductase-like protein
MQICLMIEGQEGVSWEQWLNLALACEEHGFEGLFRSDHYLSFGHPAERGTLDAWTTLSALAARTDRIRLGTLVSPVTFRHPSVLAKSVVTVDHVSAGRVEVGMGAGWFEREHRAYGFPFETKADRISMLAEQLEVVHRLLGRDEDEVTFEGRHYRLKGCPALPKPIQEPHPPLIMGGEAGPRSARLAARWADEYNVNGKTPREVAEARQRLLAAWEEEGRDPAAFRFSLMTGMVVGGDQEGLLNAAFRLMDRRGESGDPARFLEQMDHSWIRGIPGQVLERLAEYAAAGIDRVMLQHLVHEDLDTIALVGAEVIPDAAEL